MWTRHFKYECRLSRTKAVIDTRANVIAHSRSKEHRLPELPTLPRHNVQFDSTFEDKERLILLLMAMQATLPTCCQA